MSAAIPRNFLGSPEITKKMNDKKTVLVGNINFLGNSKSQCTW